MKTIAFLIGIFVSLASVFCCVNPLDKHQKALALNDSAATLMLQFNDSATLATIDASIALDSTIQSNYSMKAHILNGQARFDEVLRMLQNAEHFFEDDPYFSMTLAWQYTLVRDSLAAHQKLLETSKLFKNQLDKRCDLLLALNALVVERMLNGKDAAQSYCESLSTRCPKKLQDSIKHGFATIASYSDSAFLEYYWADGFLSRQRQVE